VLLAPCPGCRRHISGHACPFCGHHVIAAPAQVPLDRSLGRVSRALVFAGAAALGAGCGGKAKAAPDEPHEPQLERHHGGGGCAPPDQAEIDRLEKQKAEAPEEDKAAIDEELQRARQPVCMPYGAPPLRRRVV
jgi:hypothetical protein